MKKTKRSARASRKERSVAAATQSQATQSQATQSQAGAPVETGPDPEHKRRWILVALVVLSILPPALAQWPPLYDYYHWVFHGQMLVERLSQGPDSPVGEAFSLVYEPRPNMAAALLLPLLNVPFSATTAGRVFLALAALLFGLGYWSLARSLHNRPTLLELLGFAWIWGYFWYAGYIGYVFTCGLTFLLIGWVHRVAQRDRLPSTGESIALAAAIALAWCSHLIAWVILAGAVAGYVVAAALARRWRLARRLTLIMLPATGLLSWYVALAWTSVIGKYSRTETYDSIADKSLSLANPYLMFLRPDPLTPLVHPHWSNVLGLAAIAAIVMAALWQRLGEPKQTAARSDLWPLRAVGLSFWLLSILWPFGTLAGMGRPDERLAMPGFLLVLVTLRVGRANLKATALAAVPIAGILALHAAEFRDTSQRIDTMMAAIRTEVPDYAPWTALTIWNGRDDGGCRKTSHPSLGQAALKHLPLVRALEGSYFRSNVMGSGFIEEEFRAPQADLWIHLREAWGTEPSTLAGYHGRYVTVFGCPAHLDAVEAGNTTYHKSIGRTESLLILSPKPTQ